MAGKKERRSLRDKARARRERGFVAPQQAEEEGLDAKARKKVMWQLRKEQGQAGMPGAGRAHKEPSGKAYQRKPKHKGRDASLISLRVASLWIQAKVHTSPEAMKAYLKEHPNADPKDHSVQKSQNNSQDISKEPGFSALEGMSSARQREIIQRALEINEGTSGPDLSKEEGFEVLKGLSSKKQREIIQRALKNNG